MKFPRLDIKPEDMSPIGRGSGGPVYHIGDNKVAKFEWDTGFFGPISSKGKQIQREYEIARELYEGGVSVPEPFGVFSLPQPKEVDWGILPGWMGLNRYPAFVMRYIDNMRFKNWGAINVWDRMERLRNVELEKARALGFIPADCDLCNVLLDNDMSHVYLIDFTHWRKDK